MNSEEWNEIYKLVCDGLLVSYKDGDTELTIFGTSSTDDCKYLLGRDRYDNLYRISEGGHIYRSYLTLK